MATKILFYIRPREIKWGRRIWAFLCHFVRSQKLFSDIVHPRGNKSVRRIWAFFRAISCDLKNCSQTYIRVNINQPAYFGLFSCHFVRSQRLFSDIQTWAGECVLAKKCAINKTLSIFFQF